jgi:hypothetical protein
LSTVGKRLSNHEHVLLKVTKLVAKLAPCIEVVASVDGTADGTSLLLRSIAHREVLGEGPRSFNRRLVDTLSSVEAVIVTVRGEVSAQSPWFAGSKHVPGLDDVVFDERVAGPAVEREVAGTLGVVLAFVLHGPEREMLATNDCCLRRTQTHFRPARQPVPATMPPPDWPFQLQEYFPPPCCWQLN